METPTICCRTGPVAGPCSQSWMPSHTPFLSSPFAGSIPVSLSSLPLLPAVGSTVPSLHLLPTSQHTIVSTSVMSTGIMATQSGMEKPSPFSLASSFCLSQTKWSRNPSDGVRGDAGATLGQLALAEHLEALRVTARTNSMPCRRLPR